MSDKTVRTRYAPSPTGFMHVGNLRTALYEYLVAKSQGGKFILRIEDTDRERLVDGAVDVIYHTMQLAGLQHDEGPDIGGDFGPYVQSERKDMYLPYADQLIREGKAYRCFCSKERLEKLQSETVGGGYDRHCRDLPEEEIRQKLDEGVPFLRLKGVKIALRGGFARRIKSKNRILIIELPYRMCYTIKDSMIYWR